MSGAFEIRKPSLLATLPRPIDSSTGRYVVSDVHGGTPGSRKRKRGELAVGIDGEGLNIYDVRRLYNNEAESHINVELDPIFKACHLLRTSSTVIVHMPCTVDSDKKTP